MTTKNSEYRYCNDQKRMPSLDLRKCIKTRSFLSLPLLLCSRHGTKIVENYRKFTSQSSQKIWHPLSQCSKPHAVASRTICTLRSGFRTNIQNRAKLHQNASKITAKRPRKWMNIDIAMIKNAYRRLTCENASKRINVLHSRCCFAHAMDEKID